MTSRSPVLGFNHNVNYRGLVFHIQTEDSGVAKPRLFTHLYYKGIILSSRKLEYDPSSDADIVKSLMQAQHKATMKDLLRGTFDNKIDEYIANRSPDLQASPHAQRTLGTKLPLSTEAVPVPAEEDITTQVKPKETANPPTVPDGAIPDALPQTKRSKRYSQTRRRASRPPAFRDGASPQSVVLSRPPLVVTGTGSSNEPVKNQRQRTRNLRRDSSASDMPLGEKISEEKSLDDVILAYLNEEKEAL